MKKVLLATVVSVFSLTGCLEDALKEALLPENLKFSDGSYATPNCVPIAGGGGSYEAEFIVSGEGFQSSSSVLVYSSQDCSGQASLDRGRDLGDIEYGIVEVAENVSYINASTFLSDANENEVIAYTINQQNNEIYMSEPFVLDGEEPNEADFPALFLQDPQSEAAYILVPASAITN